jgi:hypothetical protein
MPKIARLLTACLAIAVSIAACGGGASDEDEIKDVTSEVASAFEGKDWAEVCEHCSAKAKTQLEVAGEFLGAEGCPETIERGAAFADSNELDFSDVEGHRHQGLRQHRHSGHRRRDHPLRQGERRLED